MTGVLLAVIFLLLLALLLAVAYIVRLKRMLLDAHKEDIQEQVSSNNIYDEQILAKAMEIVYANIANVSFSVDDFARAMGMSRSALHVKLKSLTGESALSFIRRLRFDKACELLKDGRYTVAEISDMVGFNSPSYFSSSFKKYVGCLPTEYLK